MKTINYLVTLMVGMAFLASCSVEKRVYRDGYHVEWHGKNRKEKVTYEERDEVAQQDNSYQNESANDVVEAESTIEKPVETPIVESTNLDQMDAQLPVVEEKKRPSKREAIKAINQLKVAMDKSASSPSSGIEFTGNDSQGQSHQADIIVCVIFAILIPPLGVYLFQEEITTDFWITLLLTLLFWVGALYALYVILAK